MSQSKNEEALEEEALIEEAPAPKGVKRTLALIILAMLVVLVLFMLYSHLPRANGITTASDFITPSPVLTHPVGTLNLNRSVDYNGLHITVLQVQEAAMFSDDKKHNGPYIVRIYIKVMNAGSAAINTDYFSAFHVLLPSGQSLGPQTVAIPPTSLPNDPQNGFLDFPLSTQVDMSSLVLRLGNETTVSFGK